MEDRFEVVLFGFALPFFGVDPRLEPDFFAVNFRLASDFALAFFLPQAGEPSP